MSICWGANIFSGGGEKMALGKVEKDFGGTHPPTHLLYTARFCFVVNIAWLSTILFSIVSLHSGITISSHLNVVTQ